MNFKPNPLLYAAAEDFYSSFKLAITMCDTVDHAALSRAVATAIIRYPYFSISPVKDGENLLLAFNPYPVPVFADGRSAVLGSEACHGHLLFFGCEGNRIFLNASHYIADGIGIDPLLKTVLYLYASEVYGDEGLQAERIHLPGETVAEAEYAYPFPDVPFELNTDWPMRKIPAKVYGLDADKFDGDGLYAYHLHIPQKAMMAKANPSDGSPVSFLTVMMYRAICALDKAVELPVVVHVQHQYRQALKVLDCRHSLVDYLPVSLPPRAHNWQVEQQNTALRGQIILGSERSEDLRAVNRILNALPQDKSASLAEKKAAMSAYVAQSIKGKTFGISYVGKMDLCGLERYVADIHVYIGEKHTPQMLLIEILTIGENFSINLMQSGRGRAYVDAFMEQIRRMDIPVSLVGEEGYTLCDTIIPD